MGTEFNAIHDASFIRDPLPRLRGAWAEKPIIRHDNLVTTFSVFSHADVKAGFSNPEVFGSEIPQVDKDRSLGALLDNLIAVDPPRHTRLRMLANQGFLPTVIKRFQPRAEALVEDRMKTALAQGEVDIVEDFSAQITVGMITAVLGLPLEDWPLIRQWTTDIANNTMADLWIREVDPVREATTARVTGELTQYFADYIAERKRKPKEGDVLSLLMTADLEGDRLSDQEIEGTAMLLLLAGNETTTNLITKFVLGLACYPDQLELMRQDPSLVKMGVEETLRMMPSIRGTARRAKVHTELHGEAIAPGENLFAWISTANRDPAVFEHADEFDVTRKPNPHLAFAAGPHICLGAPLARMESRLAAQALVANVKAIELIGEPDIAPTAILDNVLSQRVRVVAG
jgi:cytochrome P450